LTLAIFNVGAQDLVINSVQRFMGSTSFSVLSTPSTPLIVAPGEDIQFTLRYIPTTNEQEIATVRIISNDPAAPVVDLSAIGRRSMTIQEIIGRLRSAIARTTQWTELVNELNILINDISNHQYIIGRIQSAIARTTQWTELVNELNILINDLEK
jgi:hypothetical protein